MQVFSEIFFHIFYNYFKGLLFSPFTVFLCVISVRIPVTTLSNFLTAFFISKNFSCRIETL